MGSGIGGDGQVEKGESMHIDVVVIVLSSLGDKKSTLVFIRPYFFFIPRIWRGNNAIEAHMQNSGYTYAGF